MALFPCKIGSIGSPDLIPSWLSTSRDASVWHIRIQDISGYFRIFQDIQRSKRGHWNIPHVTVVISDGVAAFFHRDHANVEETKLPEVEITSASHGVPPKPPLGL